MTAVGSRAYLDHASTSPLRPEARDAMVAALTELSGDPGRIHEEGMAARVALETAREQVAALVGARSREVVFTSGATEAIAAAVWGAARRHLARAGHAGHPGTGSRIGAGSEARPASARGTLGLEGDAGQRSAAGGDAGGPRDTGGTGAGPVVEAGAGGGPRDTGGTGREGGAKVQATGGGDGLAHQVVSAVEHSAVRLAAERTGPVTIVPVDRGGRADPDEVVAAITDQTAAVHLQWGNHEVGTTQAVAEVAAACRERGVLLHVDAAQAVGRVPIAFDELGIDLLSLSGHKLGGPAGTGALLVRRGLRLDPLLVGGDQERARRAGLEPVAALIGLGAAASALQRPTSHDTDHTNTGHSTSYTSTGHGTSYTSTGHATDRSTVLDDEAARATVQTDRIRAAVATLDGVEVYGDPRHRLPHLVCLGIEGIEPQGVLLGLDRAGVAAHSGSACSSESLEPSPVLEAMGVDAHRSLRISVGWSTTDADVDRLLDALPVTIDRLRSLGAAAIDAPS